MKPNQRVFCNTPWYEIHIYWDGSLGICCQESHKLYDIEDSAKYNIRDMSLMQWFNSDPVRNFRSSMLGPDRVSACSRCYIEEDHGGDSRRLRSNQKSVIFTKTAFQDSYQQSPGLDKFQHSADNQGHATTFPIDLHIDLGNFCNLACKMCNSQASSTIASQEVRWGIESSRQFLGQDWTRDDSVWRSFKQQLIEIPGLNNIHFMGGETLLTGRFEELVDWLIEHGKFDVCLSFVTNGTTFRSGLLEKLKRFRRVGLEISIESVTDHNSYTRQGTDTTAVMANIARYLEHCDNSSVTVTLRPAPSVLTIGYFHTLLEWALEKRIMVKGNLCYDPAFLDPRILPGSVKTAYKQKYIEIVSRLSSEDSQQDFNASDPNQYRSTIKNYAEMCVGLLSAGAPHNSEKLLADMVDHCQRWDRVYGMDARKLYPEWADILERHSYDSPS